VGDPLARRPAHTLARPLARALVEEAAQNACRSLSEATRRAYAADWRRFEGWCTAHGLSALPADEPTIVTYLTAAAAGYELGEGVSLPPLGYGSIARLYSAIRVMHDEAGDPLPKLRKVVNTLKTLGRELGVAAKNPKKALTREQVWKAVALLTTSPADVRARAVLLVGWVIGQRRSDIAALPLQHVTLDEQGVTIWLRKSKTDQLGKGKTLAITRRGGRFCAVSALEQWLAYSRPTDPNAPILGVSAVTVNMIVKRAVASIGLDPKQYGGHSLRRGFVTSAKRAGWDVSAIMGVTGHEDIKSLQGYIEAATPFERDIGSALLADDGGEKEGGGEKDVAAKRTYVPELEDKTLKATLGELAGPTLTKAPPVVIHETTGQPLVDRKVTQEMRRRVIRVPDFLRDGKAADVGVLRALALQLESKGRSVRAITSAMKAVKVTRGDGSPIGEDDVKRWLA
jgi:site-specific recombinase XerD